MWGEPNMESVQARAAWDRDFQSSLLRRTAQETIKWKAERPFRDAQMKKRVEAMSLRALELVDNINSIDEIVAAMRIAASDSRESAAVHLWAIEYLLDWAVFEIAMADLTKGWPYNGADYPDPRSHEDQVIAKRRLHAASRRIASAFR